MKVSVHNVGVIKEAYIELKPLTVFIGPNNAGKTWLAYSLAGIFGPFGPDEYIQAYADKKVPNTYEPLDNAIERVLAEGNATIDLRRFADEYGETYFNDVAHYARNWMPRFLSTQLARFEDMDILLELAENKAEFLDHISSYSRTSRVAGSVMTIRKSQAEDKVFAYTSTEEQDAEGREQLLGERIPVEEVRERLVGFVSTALSRSLYPQVYIFPTERTTLVAARFAGRIADRIQPGINERVIEALQVLTKEIDMRELVKQNNAAREAIWPVSSFLNMLNNIFRNRLRDSEGRQKQASRDPRIKRYIQLAEILENQILAGNVYLSTPEPDPSREVLFQPTQDVNLEIPIVSSMVKELSPLVLYLRHLARPNELLIIDEPEMNLHPAAQLKIIEFLAMLVNAGLHVLITTHSSYVIDHLVNLMEAHKHKNQDKIVEMFLLEQKEAFIPQENVSAYLIEDGTVKNVLNPDGIIDWKTFSDVTKLVDRIHFELLGE